MYYFFKQHLEIRVFGNGKRPRDLQVCNAIFFLSYILNSEVHQRQYSHQGNLSHFAKTRLAQSDVTQFLHGECCLKRMFQPIENVLKYYLKLLGLV
jgi:hypothetical protein